MNSHASAPPSGRSPAVRRAAARARGLPYMSERQTKAYLLAREVVRRIQRSTPLVSAASQRAHGSGTWTPGDRPYNH